MALNWRALIEDIRVGGRVFAEKRADKAFTRLAANYEKVGVASALTDAIRFGDISGVSTRGLNMGRVLTSAIRGDPIERSLGQSSARAGVGAGKLAGRGAKGLLGFGMAHPVLVGATALGTGMAVAAHRNPTGIPQMIQEELLGDPNAAKEIVRGTIYGGVHQLVATPGERAAGEYLNQSYMAGFPTGGFGGNPFGTNNFQYGGNPALTGPSGNIVFGMYNLRQR